MTINTCFSVYQCTVLTLGNKTLLDIHKIYHCTFEGSPHEMKICTTYKCQNLWKNLWIKVLPFCFALHIYLALLKKCSFLNFHVRWKIKEQLWEKIMRPWKNYQWQFSDASKWKPVIHIQPKFIRLKFVASDTFQILQN